VGSYSSIPRAQEVRTLVNEGHIRTTSVAFLTEKAAKGAGGKAVRELLNGAFVAVPSNREAIVLSSKGYDALETETKAGARNSAADQEHLQAAHDELVALGASCAGTKSATHTRIGTKSIVGSVEALQDRVSDALEDAYGAGVYWWGYLRGVIPDGAGGGTAVFQSSAIGGDYATYSQTYTDDGAVVTLTGTAAEVDIHEIVVPDADADREQKSLAASDPAAPAGRRLGRRAIDAALARRPRPRARSQGTRRRRLTHTSCSIAPTAPTHHRRTTCPLSRTRRSRSGASPRRRSRSSRTPT
jgi:hypothetical protein